MKNMAIRFRELRKSLGMTQEEWGNIMGMSRSGIADIEAGRRNVTEKHIKLICSNPIKGNYVNESFLRTGEGEMLKSLTRQQEIAKVAAGLFQAEPESFKSRLIMALANPEESEWETLEKIAKDIVKNKD